MCQVTEGALGGPWCRGKHPPAAGDWIDSKPIGSGSFVKRDNERHIRDGEELMSPHHPPPAAAGQVSGFGSDSRILSAMKLPAGSQAPGVTTGHVPWIHGAASACGSEVTKGASCPKQHCLLELPSFPCHSDKPTFLLSQCSPTQ